MKYKGLITCSAWSTDHNTLLKVDPNSVFIYQLHLKYLLKWNLQTNPCLHITNQWAGKQNIPLKILLQNMTMFFFFLNKILHYSTPEAADFEDKGIKFFFAEPQLFSGSWKGAVAWPCLFPVWISECSKFPSPNASIVWWVNKEKILLQSHLSHP